MLVSAAAIPCIVVAIKPTLEADVIILKFFPRAKKFYKTNSRFSLKLMVFCEGFLIIRLFLRKNADSFAELFGKKVQKIFDHSIGPL
jgi:hypothetical protein